ncbi:hypothetical protein [Chiayiivirga flava]|uniref:Uncharacterized protein n=1 Tax=Chiayiivirga flava TaxID=659595 RepID=A0A7W8DA23_9GAMM|nr:hypothetical protein [Chiayiivirga flava]
MPPSSPDPALRAAILAALADAPDGVSLPKLCKRLGVRMSVLLRALAWLGEDAIGSTRGEGLVRVEARGALSVALRVRGDDGSATG